YPHTFGCQPEMLSDFWQDKPVYRLKSWFISEKIDKNCLIAFERVRSWKYTVFVDVVISDGSDTI
ncbi:MAG: hypothetical protein ACKN9A_03385, partial [Microcystis aeruginosa]